MMYWVEFSIQDLCLSSCVEVSHQSYIEGTCVWSCSLWTFGKATPGLLGLCFAVCVCCLEEVRKKDAPETLDGQAAASNILKHDMQCMRIMLVRLLEDTRHKRHKRHPYKVLHIFEHSATPRFYATRFFLVGSKIGSFVFVQPCEWSGGGIAGPKTSVHGCETFAEGRCHNCLPS